MRTIIWLKREKMTLDLSQGENMAQFKLSENARRYLDRLWDKAYKNNDDVRKMLAPVPAFGCDELEEGYKEYCKTGDVGE